MATLDTHDDELRAEALERLRKRSEFWTHLADYLLPDRAVEVGQRREQREVLPRMNATVSRASLQSMAQVRGRGPAETDRDTGPGRRLVRVRSHVQAGPWRQLWALVPVGTTGG